MVFPVSHLEYEQACSQGRSQLRQRRGTGPSFSCNYTTVPCRNSIYHLLPYKFIQVLTLFFFHFRKHSRLFILKNRNSSVTLSSITSYLSFSPSQPDVTLWSLTLWEKTTMMTATQWKTVSWQPPLHFFYVLSSISNLILSFVMFIFCRIC